MKRACSVLGFVAGIVLGSRPANAQFTADFQTNIISGVISNWTGYFYYVGNGTAFDQLQLINGGVLNVPSSANSYIGWGSADNNSVLVDGTGSVWSNGGVLFIGYFGGSGNSLVVKDGGQVVCQVGIVNLTPGGNFGSNNSVLVSGDGSVWSCSSSLGVGSSGVGHSLVISNGGKAFDSNGYIGSSGDSNIALVTGSGSIWSNSALVIGSSGGGNSLEIKDGAQVINDMCRVGVYSNSNSVRVASGGAWQNNVLSVGYQGSANSLVVSSGMVLAANLTIGFASTTCDNLVQLDSGSIVVTNATGDAVFEVRNGKLILNGGTLQVDRFVMTNDCAQFVRTGGTFLYGSAVLDPTRDDDGDGMPNGWEQSYGLDPLNADADSDADGDGQSNLAEFLAGTDPTNSASVFRITEIWPDDDDMFLTWTAVGGKRYVLQTTTGFTGSLSNDFVDLNPAIVVPGTGETEVSALYLGGATNAPAGFYRVRLVP